MNNVKLQGCGTALITPFKNGEVDYDAYRILVKRQVEAGVHFLVPLGTTAETPCLSSDEKSKLLAISAEEAAGRPLLVGVGTNYTASTIANIQTYGALGADAFLVVTPYYNKPTQEGLYQHYKAVAESTDKPIVLYNVPGRTGVNLSAETCLRLAEIPNIIAVKEASGNYSQICEIIRNAPEGFSVLSGNDDETFSLMASGAKGVVSVASNIAPGQISKLTDFVLEGKFQEARELHYKLWPLFKNCFIESNPIPTKAALAGLGLIQNELRAPLFPATEGTIAVMAETLKELGDL